LSDADHKPWNESSDGDGGTLVMAQPDDFGLIKQIVAAGGHKQLIAELDRDKISAPGRARLVEASMTTASEVSYRVTERGRAAASRF
jgi:hypothetical protein